MPSLKGKRVMITGGAGFLGTNLSLYLADRGAKLIVVDNFMRRGAEKNYEVLKSRFPGIIFYAVEISDIPTIIAKERPDLIYHFAAQVAVTSSVISPVSDFRINAEGTFHIARTAHSNGIPVVYASTNKVYGDNVNKVPIKEHKTRYDFDGDLARKGIDENFSIDASKRSPYGVSKLVGEMYVREYDGVSNRFSCMYGPYQYGIVDQGWVSYFVARKLAGEPITIFGDGKQIRDVLHVADVVRLLELEGHHLTNNTAVDLRGEVFAIGGGHENTISLLELCKELDITPSFGPWRPSDQKVFYADTTKAKRILGWEPVVGIQEGLADLVRWASPAKAG